MSAVHEQMAMDYGRLHTVDTLYTASMRALNDAMTAMSPLVASGASGIDSSDLIKMFAPGSARHFRFRSAFCIGAIASLEQRTAIAAPFNRALGFGSPVPLRPLTGDEKFAKLADRLHAMGMSGVIEETFK